MASSGIWKLKKTVVLVGMMGAGKTAVGKALAVRLGVPFFQEAQKILKEVFQHTGLDRYKPHLELP